MVRPFPGLRSTRPVKSAARAAPAKRTAAPPVTHYAIDKKHWQEHVKQRNAAEDKSADTYVKWSLKTVPLSKIQIPEAWSEAKLDQVMQAIRSGKKLPPIRAELGDAGLYVVDDGIHRVNASIKMGFSHVPVLAGELIKKR
jgi:hypothetical protein